MRIDITFENSHTIIEAPENVDSVGVTAIRNGSRMSVGNWNYHCPDDMHKRDEELVIGQGMQVILHYYSAPEIAEIMKECEGFEGMRCIEIQGVPFNIFS